MTKLSEEPIRETFTAPPVLDPKLFGSYLDRLQRLFSRLKPAVDEARADAFSAALDGQPSRELRKLYTIHALRQTGTYFTGSKMTARVLSSVAADIPGFERIIDPSCGAGDLLVGAARHLPLRASLKSTLKLWGRYLAGFDINRSFVSATRARLALLAMQRLNVGIDADVVSALETLFPNIRVQSGLDEWNIPIGRNLILSNPPFSHTQSPPDCVWSEGRVSHAAVFVAKCLDQAAYGTRLIAILPDVLRTGTRYERWRNEVENLSKITSIQILGRFDKQTDIDVFLLDAKLPSGGKKSSKWCLPEQVTRTIGQYFDIRVGPVVSFRLTGKGPWRPFVHSLDLLVGENISSFPKHIRFEGTSYDPPFVAVRRTSKANYRIRCLATLVTGKNALAVDNHLLIAIPKDGKVTICKDLLRILNDSRTSEWMNARMRCRHLTVSALRDIPWIDGDKDE